MRILTIMGFALAGVFSFYSSSIDARELATAMDVDQTSYVKVSGSARIIVSGNRFSQGDVIETQRSGQVQLLFDDQTRIVVGPNSRLIVEEILMKSGRSANRFAVTAVKGSFRFITGRSSKSAYEIRTPTATMGVRGTTFDFAVNGKRETDLAVLYGSVKFCGRSGECKRVNRGCNLAYADRRGRVGTPETREEGAKRISNGFPYLFSQKSLMSAFRTRTGSCSRYTKLAVSIASKSGGSVQGVNGPAPVSAPAGTQPATTPAGTPATTPTGSPGNSGAAGGNSAGRGGGNSDGQTGNSGDHRNN